MKRFASLLLAGLPLMFVAVIASAESSLSGWPYFSEVNALAGTGIYQLTVPMQVLDKSREDLADLRLLDSAGREVPYALRIRKDVSEQREFGGRLFNRATVANATEVSIDLGENAGEHSQIRIDSGGTNFRRLVEVEGSDTAANWRTLTANGYIFRFQVQDRVVDANRVSYPLSRYRYLRLRVHADELTDKTAPEVTAVTAFMLARDPGTVTVWDAGLSTYQLLRNQGAPASSWTIDLGGRVPCDRLYFTIGDGSFSRQFQIEVVDDPQNIHLVASGELTRRLGENSQPLLVTFDHEEYARKLRLVITDYNNPTLSISSVEAAAPAREVIFELKHSQSHPLRLFFGNRNATAPHYDFEKELAARSVDRTITLDDGSISPNPDYQPEPLPFTERAPWMIYVVLTVSSVALGVILFSLARAAMRSNVNAKRSTQT